MKTKEKGHKLIGGLLIAVVLGITYNITGNRIDEKYKKIDSNTEFEGVVKDFYLDRGSVFINLDNVDIQMINSRNLDLRPQNLGVFLQVGDRIIKKRGSEFIVICKSNIGYFFHIKEVVHRREPSKCPN